MKGKCVHLLWVTEDPHDEPNTFLEGIYESEAAASRRADEMIKADTYPDAKFDVDIRIIK